MFLTANALAIKYGIDDRIAKFFVDREPPKDNLYWKDKLLYLRPQPGYIFLPLIVDLFYKSGINLDVLLSEEFVDIVEQILHCAAEEECGLIDSVTAVKKCEGSIKDKVFDRKFLFELARYFEGNESSITPLATPFPALHRGDIFLYSLSVLEIDQPKRIALVQIWFALISTLLLMDDAEDFVEDQQSGDENAFIQSGSNREGFERLKALLGGNLNVISRLNKTMADALHRNFISMSEKPGIKEYLNN